MEPEAERWAVALAARRATSAAATAPTATPQTVARIVTGALEARQRWIAATWRSLALRALVLAAIAIGAVALAHLIRQPAAPAASILPLPAWDEFPPVAPTP